jgi:dihydrodipicolinate synthase/N-acetylneuraminate lyase
VLYNIPQVTKVAFDVETVSSLGRSRSGHWAQGQLRRPCVPARDRAGGSTGPHFRLLLGVEHLYAQAALGGVVRMGLSRAGANVVAAAVRGSV